MFYVGLDIHTTRIAFCVLSEKGQLVQRGQVRRLDEVLRLLQALPDRFEVCYEASCSYGHYPPRHPALWTKQGLAWLRQLDLPTLSQQLRRDLLLEEVETLNSQRRRLEQQLSRQARHTPAVGQLRSIPGVGIRTAEAVAAFVDDPHRFRNAKAVGRYFGLVPCQDQSGDKNRLGHITREGAPVVRQLVAEAAWQALRRSPTVRAYFERVQRGDPQRKKIALVATAHYLVRVMWAMLRRGTLWEERAQAS